MDLAYARLNPASEMVALTTWRNTKNLVITPAEILGPLDVAAMTEAAAAVVGDFPQLGCSIKEVKEGGKRYLTWEPRPDLQFPVAAWDLEKASGSTPLIDSLLHGLEASLDRDRDLFEELPGELHIVRRSRDHHVVVPLIHHVAADAGEASEFGRRLALKYQEIVTGEQSHLQSRVRALSTSMKATVPRKRTTVKDSISSMWRTAVALTRRPTLPSGSGSRTDPREYHVKRMFSEEETRVIRDWISDQRVRLSDLMVACGNIAIDRWNELHGMPPGIVTTAMTVDMRGRYRGLKEPNSTSVVFFKFSPEERREWEQFIRSVAAARRRRFTRQLDLRLSGNLLKMLDAVRRLPFNFRRRVVHHIVQSQQFSMTVTMLGVVWPLREGNESHESFPTRLGDARISEVHGIGYKLLSRTPIVFIVYIFRGQLNVVMAVAGSLFTRDEADRFADSFVALLRDRTGLA
jgi:hypothetical protein